MSTKLYFNLLHHNVFNFKKNEVNITDIVNKPSVSFFTITKIAKKNSGVVAVQDRIIS